MGFLYRGEPIDSAFVIFMTLSLLFSLSLDPLFL